MEIAVIAGTPYDAGLGADLLRAAGRAATPHPMAGSPDEQDALQFLSPDTLRAAFLDRVRELDAGGTSVAMLFCNSLSAVIDHDAVARVSSMALVSPASVYREVVRAHRRTLVVTGNGSAVVGFERVAAQAGHLALAVSDPALVRAIEAGDPAAFSGSSLPTTLRAAERMGLEAVVLACTHFTEVLPQVRSTCDIPVIDVGTRLVELALLAAGVSERSAA